MKTTSLASILLISSAILLASCSTGAETSDTLNPASTAATAPAASTTTAPALADQSTPTSTTAAVANTTEVDSATNSQDAVYAPYSEALFAEAVGKKKIALFFHATWCPTCRAMEKDITANLGNIPSDAVIIQADYDKEIALKKEYGITTQSTVVIIDKAGTALKTLSAPDFSAIESELVAIQN